MEVRFQSGNIAVSEGAMVAGLKFFAGYPITPVNEIFEYLSQELPKYGGIIYQAEDEIAAINAIIGASWAGVKAMTATSGPGYSLMAEGIGYAVMVEAPIVIVYSMRAGPSTGVATGTGQGDVIQSKWTSHGHYELIVLAPNCVQECFDLTIEAFNLAEKYRVPVIVLIDAVLSHMSEKYVWKSPSEVKLITRKKPAVPPEQYKPFKPDPEDLVPPMACYGEGYAVLAESLSHDERGYYDPSKETYAKLVERLTMKIIKNKKNIVMSETYMTSDANILFIAFGSVSRVVHAIVRELRSKGIRAGLFRPITLWPIDDEGLRKVASKAEKVIVVEMNYGQLYREIMNILRNKNVLLAPVISPDPPTIDDVYSSIGEIL